MLPTSMRAAGRRVILLSNAQSCFTRPELRLLGLAACFDRVFISSEEGFRKPDPRFFLAPLRELGLCTGHFLILGLIGLLMGMAIFLPTLHMFFDTLRSGSESEISLLYPARYYARLLRSFVFGRGTGYWTLLGYAWPTVPALILLLSHATGTN